MLLALRNTIILIITHLFIPIPKSTQILFEAAAPVLAYCSSLIPSSDAEQEHTSKILAAIRATGLIGVRLERFLRVRIQEYDCL